MTAVAAKLLPERVAAILTVDERRIRRLYLSGNGGNARQLRLGYRRQSAAAPATAWRRRYCASNYKTAPQSSAVLLNNASSSCCNSKK